MYLDLVPIHFSEILFNFLRKNTVLKIVRIDLYLILSSNISVNVIGISSVYLPVIHGWFKICPALYLSSGLNEVIFKNNYLAKAGKLWGKYQFYFLIFSMRSFLVNLVDECIKGCYPFVNS